MQRLIFVLFPSQLHSPQYTDSTLSMRQLNRLILLLEKIKSIHPLSLNSKCSQSLPSEYLNHNFPGIFLLKQNDL